MSCRLSLALILCLGLAAPTCLLAAPLSPTVPLKKVPMPLKHFVYIIRLVAPLLKASVLL